MRKPFTEADRKNRDLVLEMLKFEDSVFTGPLGQSIFADPLMVRFRGNDVISRITLDHFGFDASSDSLLEYREIFRTYYDGPESYDKEIMDAVVYFRGNRLNWYTTPHINIGDTIPDSTIFEIDGTKTTLYSKLRESPFERAIVAGFSIS